MYKNRLILRNVIAVTICLAVITMFSSCEKEPKQPHCPPIIGGMEVAVVKMKIEATKPSEGIWGISNELTTVKYENGNLELNFPDFIPNEYLGEYFWYNATNTIPNGITISDPQVKVGNISILTFNKLGEMIGSFGIGDGCWRSAQYIYADRDFTITGRSNSGLEYDCSFIKGWNIRYYNLIENNYRGKYTTQKTLSEEFEWYYEEIGCM